MRPETQALWAELEGHKQRHFTQVGQRDALLTQQEQLNLALAEIDVRTAENQRVIVTLQQTSEAARIRMRDRLQELGTRAVQSVYGPDYALEIDMDVRGARPEADIYIVSRMEGQVIRNKPQDSRGGGVMDVIAFVLRVAYICLHAEPHVAKVVLMDENLKMVSQDHGPVVADLINWLCETFGLQILFVTHNEDYATAAKRSYQVSITDGVSDLIEVDGGTQLM